MSGNRPFLLLLAGAGAALALAGCGGSAPPAPAADLGTPAAAASPVATTSVAIVNFAFSPAVITVKAGSAVTWTNRDQDAHTVAIRGVTTSQPMQNGDAYTHTFTAPGTYSYICSIHPYMHGMVVVMGG